MYGFMPTPSKIKDKSPLHGVTRRVELRDDGPSADTEGETTQDILSYLEAEERGHQGSNPPLKLPQPAFTRPDPERKFSDGVYSSIRNSNPFSEDTPEFLKTPERKVSIEVLSPMHGHPSAIPKPLFNISKRRDARAQDGDALMPASPSPVSADTSKPSRMPSYAGTGYDREIKSSFVAKKLQSTMEQDMDESSSRESSFALSGISDMVHPLAQNAGGLQYDTMPEHPETTRMLEGLPADSPKHIPWPGQTPTVTPRPLTQWPRVSRFEVPETPPPIPLKNPARTSSVRSSAGSDVHPPPSFPALLGPRIVSKENIRAHLGNISQDISEETVRQVNTTPRATPKLTSYNKNMFPRRERKGTPVGIRMGSPASQRATEGEIEMEALDDQHKK